MKKWLLALSLPALLCAQDFYGPLGMGGCWEFGGDALYWKACTPTFDLGTANNQFLSAKSDWDLGFRVYGGYYSDSCCSFVRLDWTYFRDSDTDFTDTRGVSTDLFFFPGAQDVLRVSGKIRTKYNKINLRGGRYLHRGCDVGFYVYGGARYIDLNKKLTTFIRTEAVENSVFQKAEYTGGGAEIGVGTVYQIVGNLGLKAEVGAIAALGEQKLHIQTNNNGAKRNIRFGNRTHCVFGTEWRAALQFSGRIKCFLITAEVGYEVDYYFDPIAVAVNSKFQRESQNMGFAGPYAGLSLRF